MNSSPITNCPWFVLLVCRGKSAMLARLLRHSANVCILGGRPCFRFLYWRPELFQPSQKWYCNWNEPHNNAYGAGLIRTGNTEQIRRHIFTFTFLLWTTRNAHPIYSILFMRTRTRLQAPAEFVTVCPNVRRTQLYFFLCPFSFAHSKILLP